MRALSLAAAVALAAVAAPPASLAMDGMGTAAAPKVSIAYQAFLPGQVDALSGDTVMWHNDSFRSHTVTADDGSFGSGTLLGGQTFQQRFTATGSFTYYCRIHAGMRGEVDVHAALLDAPAQSVVPNSPYPLHGRAAVPEGGEVTIEADSGGGFTAVTTARVRADGMFTATVVPAATTHYRAVAAGGASPPVLLVVENRTVHARAARHGRRVVITARVSPRSPRGLVVLQLHLPERFGWWPSGRARLDGHSRARFVINTRREVRARVVLTMHDGATPLATGPVLRVSPATS